MSETEVQISVPCPPRLKRTRAYVREKLNSARKIAIALGTVGAVLSGLAGFWTFYKVVNQEILAPAAGVDAESRKSPGLTAADPLPAAPPPRLSIAVLPFDNLDSDRAQDYFVDGIVESLTTDLSVTVPDLLVIDRAAAATYKGKPIDAKHVGRELGVHYLLQGSVIRDDKKARINVRLVDTQSGLQIWSDRFDSDLSGLLSVEDAVTARIAALLGYALTKAGAQEAEKRSSNSDAFDMLLRARAALNLERDQHDVPRARSLELYRKALAIDPDNAEAMNGVAMVLTENMYFSARDPRGRMTPEQVKASIAEAQYYLEKARAAKGNTVEAFLARSYIYGNDRRWNEAEQQLIAARAVNPNYLTVLIALSESENWLGEPEKALAVLADALRRTAGKSPQGWWIYADMGFSNILLGRWDDAIENVLKSRASFSRSFFPHYALAIAYAHKGQMDLARESYAELFKLGKPSTLARMRSNAGAPTPKFADMFEATWIEGLRKLGHPEN